jgi:hypothetical protein
LSNQYDKETGKEDWMLQGMAQQPVGQEIRTQKNQMREHLAFIILMGTTP